MQYFLNIKNIFIDMIKINFTLKKIKGVKFEDRGKKTK